ncbi:MAG: hypothetical protein TREMPRED_003549 [Tremellales sp. Tagirdzhanova-0007]|nr:MAG: hypothetical protein TREMPRED_003549 [Tremellales sp. Tagirdzhanova-0007]
MHLLFVDGNSFMGSKSAEELLEKQSVKQLPPQEGKIYDETGESVKPHIESFIKTYQLPMEELLIQDLDQYPTFNSFFSRRLIPTARPITSPNDPSIVTSPADSRMTVFQTVDQAKQFWIKGRQFTIPNLLVGKDTKDDTFQAIQNDGSCALAIARLAPQDYHRFHSPVDGEVIAIKDIHGELYTVNPQAINENLDVFTMNKRSVMLIHANFGPSKSAVPIAFVAVGAMLVGSIGWSKKAGDRIAKGEELGWFQYGGSTTICVFPSAARIVFDEDMTTNSEHKVETLVKVGMEIARVN